MKDGVAVEIELPWLRTHRRPWKEHFCWIPRRNVYGGWVWGRCAKRTVVEWRSGKDSPPESYVRVNQYTSTTQAITDKLKEQ